MQILRNIFSSYFIPPPLGPPPPRGGRGSWGVTCLQSSRTDSVVQPFCQAPQMATFHVNVAADHLNSILFKVALSHIGHGLTGIGLFTS